MIVEGIIAGVLVLHPLPPEPAEVPAPWGALADCESGEWGADGRPIAGTRRWDHDGHRTFEGGLQFHPATWDGYREPGMPDHAYDATRWQQVEVAERVQAEQGWGAWPVCSRKAGLR